MTFTVPATLLQPDGSTVPNPNYISGIPRTWPAGAPLTVQYNLVDHMPAGYQQGTSNEEETFSHTAGLRAKLPGEWNADFYTTYGTVENCGVCIFDTQVNFGPSGRAAARHQRGLHQSAEQRAVHSGAVGSHQG